MGVVQRKLRPLYAIAGVISLWTQSLFSLSERLGGFRVLSEHKTRLQ